MDQPANTAHPACPPAGKQGASGSRVLGCDVVQEHMDGKLVAAGSRFQDFTETTVAVATTTSHDGGRSFWPVVTVRGPRQRRSANIRCCSPRSPPTPRPGTLCGLQRCVRDADAALVARSTDGRRWSRPVVTNHDNRPSYQHYTASVSA